MDKRAYNLFFIFWVAKELIILFLLLLYYISVSICLFLNLSPFESLASLLTGFPTTILNLKFFWVNITKVFPPSLHRNQDITPAKFLPPPYHFHQCLIQI